MNNIYLASRDGWMFKDFFLRCKGKAPTLILIHSKRGSVFGGLTFANWQET